MIGLRISAPAFAQHGRDMPLPFGLLIEQRASKSYRFRGKFSNELHPACILRRQMAKMVESSA